MRFESQEANFPYVGPGGTDPRWDNPKIAMAEEAARQQAIIEAERAARQAEAMRLAYLTWEDMTWDERLIAFGSDYPGMPGATPVPGLFPEHGEGVPALYSEPDLTPEQWTEKVETIIETSLPLPGPINGMNGPDLALSAQAGQPGSGAGLGLSVLAVLLL